MASVNSVKKEMNGTQLVPGERLTQLVTRTDVKKRFEEILGKRAPGFISSIISAVNSNKALATCDPNTVLSAAVIAATLDLPINQNLGFAAIVPYSGQAQFQMMYKGFIQLAQRTGQYKTMNVAEVYADEIDHWNPITGEIVFTPQEDHKQRAAGDESKIIGYVAFFELVTGFRKYLYMTLAQIEAHARKYSKSYSNPGGMWKKDPHVMRLKTVLKILLSKYGPLSIDVQMQRAITMDQGVVQTLPSDSIDTAAVTYPDNGTADDTPAGAGSLTEEQVKVIEQQARGGAAS